MLQDKLLLVIDVGNTQTVIGIYEDGYSQQGDASAGLVGHWRVATVASRTEDEMAVLFDGFFSVHSRDFLADIGGVAISSGVPRVTASLRSMSARYLACEPVVLAPGVKSGIAILYDNPREVGADRIANAAGAYDLTKNATIVVDFGTGTTFDAISTKGEYLGGAIAPGVEISLDALVERASALQAIELLKPRNVIGKSTVESIQSGVLYGYASQVDGLCQLFREEMISQGNAPDGVQILATGGIADVIVPFSKTIQRAEPWLTLHGLRKVWEKNRPS